MSIYIHIYLNKQFSPYNVTCLQGWAFGIKEAIGVLIHGRHYFPCYKHFPVACHSIVEILWAFSHLLWCAYCFCLYSAGFWVDIFLRFFLLTLLGVMVTLDYIWSELQFRNWGHNLNSEIIILACFEVDQYTFEGGRHTHLWSRCWGSNIHLESGPHLLEAYTRTKKKAFSGWKILCSLPACSCFANTSISSPALKSTLEFQHVV